MLLFLNSYKKHSDEKLMELVKEGKEKAFEELFDRYKKKMHYYFYRMLNSDTDLADDFLQDLFMKIIERPNLFSGEKKFSTWIYSVASNMCKNEYRRVSIRKEVKTITDLDELYKEDENISINMDKALFNSKLKEEISSLGEDYKEILILRFQENLSIKEISTIVNIPEGTIKSRLFYTVKKLSEKLKIYRHN
jgi:RNA polymerase sigma-70 factor (ECF subfamily)